MIVNETGFVPPSTGDLDGNSPVVGWHNLVTPSNVSADSEDPDYPASNLGNPNTSSFWRATYDSGQTISVALGGETVDYVGIAGHNFGTAAVTVSLLASDGGSPNPILIGEFVPEDDAPIILRFNARALTGLTLRLGNSGSPSALPQAAVLYVGELLYLPRRIWAGHTPIVDGLVPRLVDNVSESGNFLGRIVVGEVATTSFNLSDVDPELYRSDLRPFVQACPSTPFFFGWRPLRYPEEVGFVWTVSQPRPVNQVGRYGLVNISFDIAGMTS
jgi:hypothetical protein